MWTILTDSRFEQEMRLGDFDERKKEIFITRFGETRWIKPRG